MTIFLNRPASLNDASPGVSDAPRVSVIMPVFNAERFLGEAVESVRAQTYPGWELLLIDDGSTDGSTALAQGYAAADPARIRYLAHPDGGNRGASATRNLGIAHARGEYLALLDADDVWLPEKLAVQVAALDAHPSVGLVCNDTLIWHSWTESRGGAAPDYTFSVGVAADTILPPPTLLALAFRGKAASPCTCSLLIRHSLVEEVGGFEEEFRRTFTDQVLYAKLFLETPVLVLGGIMDKYRQHPDSSCAVSLRAGKSVQTELQYLDWLESYLVERGLADSEAGQALRWYRYWRHGHPKVYQLMRRGQILAQKLRKRAAVLRSSIPFATRREQVSSG
jgi:glycosyltransferase involved in cell wall biosynthesis